MKLTKVFIVVMILMVGAYLVGCCGGSKETVVVPQSESTTTLGQELLDLDEAYKKGAITKDEYETAKKKLLEQKSK
jgi:uncharacterized membrane protein